MYNSYLSWESKNQTKVSNINEEEIEERKNDNQFSRKVIGYGVLFTGIGVALLGGMSDSSRVLVITTGCVFALLGIFIIKKKSKND